MKNNTQQKSDFDYRINRARMAGAEIIQFPERKGEHEKICFKHTGCETTPDPSPLPARIIPFPGATLAAPDDDFQTQIDGFLREIGYIE